MRRALRIAILSSFLAVALAVMPTRAPGQDATPDDAASPDSVLAAGHFLHWESVGDAQLAPDGEHVLFTRARVDRVEDSWESAIWIMEADGSRKRFLADGSSPVWSPDGERVAYLAEGEPSGTQVFVRWMDAEGGPTQVTHLSERPRNLQWSPDGSRLSFLMDVPAESGWSADVPAPPEGAEWTEPPRVVHRIHYRADGVGFTEEAFTHLFTVPADGGSPRRLTSGEWNVGARFDGLPFGGSYDWVPDGSAIVFDGWREGDPDRNFRSAHLYAVDLESLEIRKLTEEAGTWTAPEVSPDGRTVAFTGFAATERTYVASDLWALPLDGSGSKRKLSGALDRDPQDLIWADDGSGVYFTAEDRGSQNVHFAPLSGEGPRRVTEGERVVELGSIAAGTAVGEVSSPHRPDAVFRFDLADPDRLQLLTAVNADVLDGVTLGDVEEIWYRSEDGTRVQGWIVKPPGFDPSGPRPLVLHIHGGPHAMYDVGFSFSFQHFAANGYLVLYTNPRGSTGYGTEFGAAISKDYPSVDHQDLMAGVDSLVARGWADPDRLFVTGCSGGGVLSSWAIGQTDRFAAAAVRCPVTDWISMAGTTDIPFFTFNFFDVPFWEDPSEWLAHSSLMHVDEIETPTLLMTGELDLRTPMSQTEELYMALKMRGVPTVLLRFQDQYHGTGSAPSNFLRTQSYILEWFEKEGRIDGLTVEGESSDGE